MPQIKNDLSVQIEKMLETEHPSDVFDFIKASHKTEKIENSTLAKIFLAYVNEIGWENEDKGISQVVLIDDLCAINTYFRPTNGNQWARSNVREIGEKYIIKRENKGNKAYSIQLIGFNNSLRSQSNIRQDIRDTLSKQRCVVLDTSSQIEIDHKNGRYNDENVANTKTQKLEDFQPLHKTVNDVKRMHCKNCLESKKRYNAQRLGYKEGWIEGNENDTICNGCYWYDPKQFNETISKNFVKQNNPKIK